MRFFASIVVLFAVLLCSCGVESSKEYTVLKFYEYSYLQKNEEVLFVCDQQKLNPFQNGDEVTVKFNRIDHCKHYDSWCGTGRIETGYVNLQKIKK